ncbi:MAG TPA: prolyl oligopeptidase family serine peptidase [Polyangiaceae bacterium]|nr:prolyl oligopeptidase family serine peptidase [Polyangiaceae bacterium]
MQTWLALVACGVALACTPATTVVDPPVAVRASPPASLPAVQVLVQRSGDPASSLAVDAQAGAPQSGIGQGGRPMTRREHVTDDFFGVRVLDPYRWLEDSKSEEVKSWIEAQNTLTRRTLASYGRQRELHQQIEAQLAIGTLSAPVIRRLPRGGVRIFYTRREGKQEQPVLYIRDGLAGRERMLLDVNALDRAGTTALDYWEPSWDGQKLAYGASFGGSEHSTLYVRDVERDTDLTDRIENTRFGSVVFSPDGKRFFYTRYPSRGSVPAGEEDFHRRVYEHVIGQAPESDRLVFGAELDATAFTMLSASPNGRWLVANVSHGWSQSALYLCDLRAPEPRFTRITPEGENIYQERVRDDAIWVTTNEGAPRYRAFRVDPLQPAREKWRQVVAEHPTDVLQELEPAGDSLYARYGHAGASRLERFTRSGRVRGSIELPSEGSSDGFSVLPDGSLILFGFESFVHPPEIRQLDASTGRSSSWLRVHASVRSGDYTLESRTARSPDGTTVPYRLIRKTGVDLTRSDAPTVLYGYGGFNQNMEPRFSRSLLVFLEHGGVFAQALLRGGGEFGEDWHRAGQGLNKQHTFDDFLAVAEDLTTSHVTRPGRLAIQGRSNGGLLVAAAVTQRPELFRAAVAGVPLTDMLRYPRFSIGRLWVPEYGSPEKPDEFRALFAYSPYHRVRPTQYPAVLVTTAAGDTRVDPLHARKWVAALQHANLSTHSILLRTEQVAGHGAGTPLSKQVAELTDVYTFLFHELGMTDAPKQDAASD